MSENKERITIKQTAILGMIILVGGAIIMLAVKVWLGL